MVKTSSNALLKIDVGAMRGPCVVCSLKAHIFYISISAWKIPYHAAKGINEFELEWKLVIFFTFGPWLHCLKLMGRFYRNLSNYLMIFQQKN